MKSLTIPLFLITALGCSSPTTGNDGSSKKPEVSGEENNFKKTSPDNTETKSAGKAEAITFQTSTYDDPEFAKEVSKHKSSLKQLSDKKVFSAIHAKLVQELSPKHRDYLKSKPDYELLALAKGNLFRENKMDCGFIVYDKTNQRIAILIYREMTNKYAELFRELKVENGLENAGCNYSSFGTIDYQLAGEIIYQEEYLLKNPENYLESSPIKITDVSKDEDFFLQEGCFSKKVSKKETANALGIATSCVYNNWEALRYNQQTNSFIIFFGQAFAD